MKEIEHKISNWAKYVCVDEDGTVHQAEIRPALAGYEDKKFWVCDGRWFEKIGKIDEKYFGLYEVTLSIALRPILEED